MTRSRVATLVVGAALGVAAIAGCKAKAPVVPGASSPAAIRVPLVVRVAKDGNGGRPLYLVVRTTTQKSFVEDDYSTIAALVVAPDATVIERIVVFPGQVYVVDLEVAKLPETLAVYGLFTRATGESWKRMFEETRQIEITVGAASLGP